MDQEGARVLDWAAVGVWIGAFVELLPAAAALLSIVWTVMRIIAEWDNFSRKVKGWFEK